MVNLANGAGTVTGNICPGDLADYFVITTTGQYLAVNLSVPPDTNLDLYGYNADQTAVFTSTAAGNEAVLKALPRGRYYVKVEPSGTGPAYAAQYTVAIKDMPVINGDFENGWLGWTHGRDAFMGCGTGLAQTLATAGRGQSVLLGNPADNTRDGSIPVGYGYISQTLYILPGSPTLTLAYRVHSFDTVWGEGSKKYWDTFEVSINKRPPDITDADRNARGCKTDLNPAGMRTPTGDGLVVCGGAPIGNTSEWDSGWKQVQLNVSAFADQTITLYFASWNREYGPQNCADKGWRNTYSYIDDVQVIVP
jgi:hypothetical protein